jgi:hypothetical protein
MLIHSSFTSSHLLLPLTAALLLTSPAANATLGEPESSVAADGQQLHSAVKMSVRAGYRVQELRLSSGTSVREYATADGAVFAVAWSGPAQPDLRQTLGRYFDVYTAGARANAGHTHLHFQQEGLVVEANGHMRAFAGRAYLPQAVPAGTSLKELR